MSTVDGSVTDQEFAALRGAARDEAFMATERTIRSLQAAQARRIGMVESSGSFRDDGHRSVTAWVAMVTNCLPRTAERRVREARLLADLQHLRGAAEHGDVGSDQLRLLWQLHANRTMRPQLPAWDRFLTLHARSLVADGFQELTERWRLGADPDGCHRDHTVCRDRRHVSTAAIGVGHRTIVEGDARTGELCADVLAGFEHAELQRDLALRRDRFGDDADRHPLARTGQQRRYDAWVRIHEVADAAKVPGVRRVRTGIVTDPATAQDALNASLGTSVELFGRSFDPVSGRTPLARTTGGAPVDLHDLAAALALGTVHAMIVDAAGQTVGVSSTKRLFTGRVRDAVLFRDDRCARCRRRHADIQVDHMAPHGRGGATSCVNGAPLCGVENRVKHDQRLRLTRDATGWHWWRPDGTEIAPRAGPADSGGDDERCDPSGRGLRTRPGANGERAGPDAA